MSFGQELRAIRKARGLDPVVVAYHIQATPATIYNYEARTRSPEHLERYKKLAATLGITLDELANLGAETTTPKTGAAA